MSQPRGPDEMSEIRFCNVIGGAWRVPLPAGPGADLVRALAEARPAAPGTPLPEAVAAPLAGLPALTRPGAAVLLAPPARAEAALLALAQWLHAARPAGHAAALSLIQPVPAGFTPEPPAGWRFIPLFSARLL